MALDVDPDDARAELGRSITPQLPVPDTGEAALTFDAAVTGIRRIT